MEFAACEFFLELVPVLGFLTRRYLLNWPLGKVEEERRRCRRLVALRSERLRALDAQGVDLMALYRQMNQPGSAAN